MKTDLTKLREFFVSGVNFDSYNLDINTVITAFLTINHPGSEDRPRKETIRVREVSPELDAAYAECERALGRMQKAMWSENVDDQNDAYEDATNTLAALRKARDE